MADREADRLSIPTSRMNEEQERRSRRYADEARSQDLSDADDASRDKGPLAVSGGARERGLPGRDGRAE